MYMHLYNNTKLITDACSRRLKVDALTVDMNNVSGNPFPGKWPFFIIRYLKQFKFKTFLSHFFQNSSLEYSLTDAPQPNTAHMYTTVSSYRKRGLLGSNTITRLLLSTQILYVVKVLLAKNRL